MKNYREQCPPISCSNCRHSFDVDYYEMTCYRCTIDFPLSAETLYEYYNYRGTDKKRRKEIGKWRYIIEEDHSRCVSPTGICEYYERKG